MRRYNSIKRNNYIIIGLCMVLVMMGIAYAAFASQLKISGTSAVTSSFIVKITSITPKNIVGTATDDTSVTTHTDTTATFGVNLVVPGDSITYDITVENQGSVNAILKTITKTDTDNSAILFETSGLVEGTELVAGDSTTMTVTVTYNPEVTSQPENLTSKLTVTLDYVQRDLNKGVVEPVSIGGINVYAVSSGDGLYEDTYESERYIYKGANPNNYIQVQETDSSTALYRIISIESDGTYKIIRNDSIGSIRFDDYYGRYDTTTYCKYSVGCNIWGSKTTMLNSSRNSVTTLPMVYGSSTTYSLPEKEASINTYLNSTWYSTLSSSFTNKITSYLFKVGHVVENETLEKQITQEKTYLWQGNIGFMNVTDYIRANTNIKKCGTQSLNDSNYITCQTTNWLFKSKDQWTINPKSGESPDLEFYVSENGVFRDAIGDTEARPVLYLSSSITFEDGTDGSSSNPYKIAS